MTTEFDTSTVFNEKQILRCYEMLYEEFELPFKQAKLIVKEIESHSGLILQSSNETFEFSHKSIHEYLTAEYISRMSHLPRKTALLLKIPNELAIATALSSEPNDFMFTLFIKCLKIKTREASFVNAYLGRLHLEKPDYKLEPTLGYIFAFIYSTLHLGDVNAIKNISYTVYTDNLAKTNELLLKLMNANANVRKSINKILHFYEVTFPYNFSSSNNSDIGLITTLQKRFDIPHYLDYKRLKNQPENIVVPAFFIKTTPNPRQR